MAGLMEGKAGLVTGAASGIGRACALRFGREGASVVVSDLETSRAGGEETVQTIVDAGGRAEFFARGTFLGMKFQIRQMLAGGGGAIVNSSSNAGLRGVHLIGAYAASKHGILGLTKNGAIEYANDGIRVNAVCPGAITTPLMSNETPERQQQILRPQAMTRFGEPAEVAAAVVWLCSEDAGFITGISMPVDAGSVAGW